MIRNIILALFGFVVIAVVALWILGGGPKKILQDVRLFAVSTSTETTASSTGFSLPWQPPNLFPTVNEDDLFAPVDDGYGDYGAEAQLGDIQQQYDQIAQDANSILTFGEPSPFFKTVRIVPSSSHPQSETANAEYIVIEAPFTNSSPVPLVGWSIQSAVSGIRIPIPGAASPFFQGAVNNQDPISLNPGASAVIVSGVSPVGGSFRENRCTGFLSQYQSFEPSLERECPAPSSELALTPNNINQYGDACFDFVRTLPSCEFPSTLPNTLSPSCRSFVQTIFSYNGCVNKHLPEQSFSKDSWRLFIGANGELWRNGHDAIRLLDGQGQTVDVFVY